MKLKRALARHIANDICMSTENTRKVTFRKGVTKQEIIDDIYRMLVNFEDFVEDKK